MKGRKSPKKHKQLTKKKLNMVKTLIKDPISVHHFS